MFMEDETGKEKSCRDYQREVILRARLQNFCLFSLAETKADTGNNYSLKTQ